MMPAQNRGGGMNLGFPDTCNTPVGPATAPVPYLNVASNAQAATSATTVFVNMMNALNQASVIAMTSGDEAGVAHATIKGPGRFTAGNPTVFIEQAPAIALLAPATGNGGNCAAALAVVPSSVNVLYSDARNRGASADAGDPFARSLDEDAAAELGRVEACSRLDASTDADGVARVIVHAIGLDAGARVEAHCVRSGARALVLDLRGCPGGSLDGAVDLAGRLLGPRAVVAQVVDADGDAVALRASGGAALDLPVEVLVDGATASAAEVVAAALDHHGRARVEGGPTAGKSRAQQVTARAGGAFATASVVDVLDPAGRPLGAPRDARASRGAR